MAGQSLGKMLSDLRVHERRQMQLVEATTEEQQDDHNIDDDLPEDFDPKVVIGEIRGKVDSIKWMLDKWEAEAQILQEQWIKRLQKRKAAIENNVERLKEYVKQQMLLDGSEELQGEIFNVRLKNQKPAVDVKGNPNADMYLKYKDEGFIKQKTSYQWDKAALKERLEAGEEIPFATLREVKGLGFPVKIKGK